VGNENVVQEVGDEGLECDRVLEEGEDIEEGDSLDISTYRLDRDGEGGCTFLGKSGWTPRRDLRYAISDIVQARYC